MAAKTYYNEVFLAATNDALMTMMQTGELVPGSQCSEQPCKLEAADTPPVAKGAVKRKLVPKEADVHSNQKGLRVLAARNVLAHFD